MTEALCVLCRRRQAVTGLLCGPDLDRLGRHLDPGNAGQPFDPARPSAPVRSPSIPQLYRGFADVAAAEHRNGAQQRTEHAEHALLDEHAISVRDVRSRPDPVGPDDRDHAPRSVLATVGTWARTVHEEHVDLHGRPDPLPPLARPPWVETRLPVPHVGDPAAGWRTVRLAAPAPPADVQAVFTLCQWLHARLEWLARQPWIGELVDDLRAITAALRAGQGDGGTRPLGPCTGLVDADGEPVQDDVEPDGEQVWQCGEPLFMPALPPKGPDEPLVPPAVRCGACGARWSGLDLLKFAHDRGVMDLAG